MRTLTLAAATAGLVLLPSAAYAGESVAPVAVGAVGVPERLTAYCNGAATVTTVNQTGFTFAITATAVSHVGVSTAVRCEVRGSWGSLGGVALALPGPVVATAGTVFAPFYAGPYQLCVTASAVYPDATTASLPWTCHAL